MDNKDNEIRALREQREFETLFKNPKYARSSWARKVYERYTRPAMPPIIVLDKDGNETERSQIERQIYAHLVKELQDLGEIRQPSDGEFQEACMAYYARHNAASYTARQAAFGAKPVNESKQTVTENVFENLTDEELELLAAAREKKREQEQKQDE